MKNGTTYLQTFLHQRDKPNDEHADENDDDHDDEADGDDVDVVEVGRGSHFFPQLHLPEF